MKQSEYGEFSNKYENLGAITCELPKSRLAFLFYFFPFALRALAILLVISENNL